MIKIKKILEDRKQKKDLQERLVKLEKDVASLKMSIDIVVDSRLSYLETNYTNIKRIQPEIEHIYEDLKSIKAATIPKERKKDDKDSVEIV